MKTICQIFVDKSQIHNVFEGYSSISDPCANCLETGIFLVVCNKCLYLPVLWNTVLLMVGNVHCINGFKNYLQTFKVLSQMYLSWTLIVFLLATQDFIAFGFANTNWPYFFFVLRIPLGVAVSYSLDFLICIKFCATMVIVLNPPACFARLACL